MAAEKKDKRGLFGFSTPRTMFDRMDAAGSGILGLTNVARMLFEFPSHCLCRAQRSVRFSSAAKRRSPLDNWSRSTGFMSFI
ncbi:MAG: hypothetical protein WBW33_05325 [Bryobacteraceae bacterium]